MCPPVACRSAKMRPPTTRKPHPASHARAAVQEGDAAFRRLRPPSRRPLLGSGGRHPPRTGSGEAFCAAAEGAARARSQARGQTGGHRAVFAPPPLPRRETDPPPPTPIRCSSPRRPHPLRLKHSGAQVSAAIFPNRHRLPSSGVPAGRPPSAAFPRIRLPSVQPSPVPVLPLSNSTARTFASACRRVACSPPSTLPSLCSQPFPARCHGG
jgi:hypothetical protein